MSFLTKIFGHSGDKDQTPYPKVFCKECGGRIIFRKERKKIGFDEKTGDPIFSENIVGECSGYPTVPFDMMMNHNIYFYNNGLLKEGSYTFIDI